MQPHTRLWTHTRRCVFLLDKAVRELYVAKSETTCVGMPREDCKPKAVETNKAWSEAIRGRRWGSAKRESTRCWTPIPPLRSRGMESQWPSGGVSAGLKCCKTSSTDEPAAAMSATPLDDAGWPQHVELEAYTGALCSLDVEPHALGRACERKGTTSHMVVA